MSTEQYDALATLADRVVDVLELRLRTSQLEHSLADLTAARDELHRSNAQLAGFVGQVSHDMRTPLTGVLGFVEELADLPVVTGDEGARWMAQRALASGERMRDLIEELLTYAQVGGSLRLAPVDLAEVASDVVHDLDTVLRDAGAVVRVGRLPVVHGDAVQLRALLQNLMANAAKFRRPGVAPRIVLSARRIENRWQVEVSDNGTGVAPDQRERVFELLARGEGVAAEGSGIGLATCKRIVEAHGGTIGVHAAPDGGASVRVELPVVA
jgi:signal transduction histidine kinase